MRALALHPRGLEAPAADFKTRLARRRFVLTCFRVPLAELDLFNAEESLQAHHVAQFDP